MKKDCKYCKHAIRKSGYELECTAEEFDPENLTCFEPKTGGQNTDTEKKEIPMIPKYQAQRDSMHQGRMNRNMLIAVCVVVAGFVIFAICMVWQAHVFVSGYNARTKDWLSTIRQLQNATEVTDGYQADP